MTQSYFDVAPYFLEPHVSASYLRAGDKLTPQPFNFDTGITTSNSGLKSPITDMAKYAEFLLGIHTKNPLNAVVLKRSSLEEAWKGILPVTDPGEPATPYTTGAPQMGLGFFVTEIDNHGYIYHDGDQGGFSSEMFLDPARHIASLLIVNTTDTGAPSTATHAESNTEPNPATDLRLTLRRYLIDHVFPQQE
jgi:CubicO group peptidase (beta-lactamase class C family)